MAAVQRGGHVLTWEGDDSFLPPDVSIEHTVRSEGELRAVFKETEREGVAYLKIRIVSQELIALIRELAQGSSTLQLFTA